MVRIPYAMRVFGCTALALAYPAVAMAQTTTLEAYSTVLQQIADKKLTITQREHYISEQEEEIAFLRSQIEQVRPTSRSVRAIIDKMAAQAEDAINSDLPFLLDERFARVQKLKGDIADPKLPITAKFRRALNVYQAEVNYGFDIESYPGESPLNPGESPNIVSTLDDEGEELLDENTGEVVMEPEQGDYLRYGRLSLVFLNQRATTARRYDVPSGTWIDLSGADLQEVRRAVRVSKGQSAPAVLLAPVNKSE